VNDVESELHSAGGIDIILQVLFNGKIPDDGNQFQVVIVLVDIDVIIVVAVNKGGVGKEAAVKYMIPAECGCGIAPLDPEYICKSQYIPPEITGKIDPVVVIEFVVGLGVDIIEIKFVPVDGTVL